MTDSNDLKLQSKYRFSMTFDHCRMHYRPTFETLAKKGFEALPKGTLNLANANMALVGERLAN